MRGLAATDLPDGTRYMAIHYTADEDKRGPEFAEFLRGIPVRERLREYELVEDLWSGVPVYADFNDAKHGASALTLLANDKVFGGWDAGQTLIPAFVCLGVSPIGQVRALFEVVSKGDDAMETFAPQVSRAITDYPGMELRRRDIDHWADATVNQRSGGTGRTAAQVAAVHGFDLHAASNVWEPRRSAVTWLLTDTIADGEEKLPRFLIDRERCPVLYAGFMGAYKLEESTKGEAIGPGRILEMPLKNSYSHVHDALQYPAMMIRTLLQPKPGTKIKTVARRYV